MTTLSTFPKTSPTGSASQEELKNYSKRNLIIGALLLLAMFVVLGLTGLRYESEMTRIMQIAADRLGIWGLIGVVFISDSIISPIPPDLALLVIAKSSMRADWLFYVLMIAVASTLAGNLAYLIGRFMGNLHMLPPGLKAFSLKHQASVHKYGPAAVILGCITPLPFSMTCWSAGFLKMSYRKFLPAVLTRFPRIIIYYWVIHASDVFQIFSLNF